MDKSFELLCMAYSVLSDVTNNWPGRNTTGGQKLLCDMRDHIAKIRGVSPEEVQNDRVGR